MVPCARTPISEKLEQMPCNAEHLPVASGRYRQLRGNIFWTGGGGQKI